MFFARNLRVHAWQGYNMLGNRDGDVVRGLDDEGADCVECRDVVAGLSVAAVAVPQAMAYALIVGLPPEIGLYTAIVMTTVGALLDSSKQLINGPTNAISIATAIVFGLAPAFRMSRPDLRGRMTRGSSRRVLVVAEVSLAVILVAGASLLLRSFVALQRVDLGFSASNVLFAELNLPPSRYDDWSAILRLHQGLVDRLEPHDSGRFLNYDGREIAW